MGVPYKVVPGQSVGDFILGDSLWHILDVLRTKKLQYPRIEVSWDDEKPLTSAVVISLPHLILYFPASRYQVLALISLPDLPDSSLSLEYEDLTLSAPKTVLTRGKVGKILGPTYAGTNGKLSYPGISFELVVSNTGNGRDDVVSSMMVVPKSEAEGPKLISPLESCTIHPGRGVMLHIPGPLDIVLGQTTAQDLLLDLGPPLRKFYKEDNRLERMWAATESPEGSCFWNYFQYGLDFLVDAKEGTVIKIICHTNIPGTPLFQRYARCPWLVPCESGDSLSYTSSLAAFRAALSSQTQETSQGYHDEMILAVPVSIERPGSTSGKKKKKKTSPSAENEVVAAEQSHSGSKGVADTEEDAMVLDRTVEGGLDGVIGLGSSRLVGFPGLVIEEDTESGGITSLLIFPDQSAGKDSTFR